MSAETDRAHVWPVVVKELGHRWMTAVVVGGCIIYDEYFMRRDVAVEHISGWKLPISMSDPESFKRESP